jgi:hypothetical protein
MGVILRHLSTSDFALDGTRLRSFRYGEAPKEERELRILVPIPDEVEPYLQFRDQACSATGILSKLSTASGWKPPQSLSEHS